MIPRGQLSSSSASFLSQVTLEKSQDSVKKDQPLTLSLGFKVEGAIREAFTQKNWERAYNKHDNAFRMTIEVNLKAGRKTIMPLKFVRKAAFFWTRNPKIPHRIWVSIVKDDSPHYPLSVEEAQGLLFDVQRVIEREGTAMESGQHQIVADVRVSWGKHEFTQSQEISGRSNEIQLTRLAA
jgi:hypothetical protein